MPLLSRVPPGRSGRIWLQRRYATAARGREQLDRRLRILLPELTRLREHAGRCRADWETACADAYRWQARVVVSGGQDAVRARAYGTEPVRFALQWRTLMGVRYPAEVSAVQGAVGRRAPTVNAAVPPAAAAFHAAVLAGARTAAAEESVRRFEVEVAVTRRRLRALDRRWLPSLRAAIARLDLALEEAEREDAARLHHLLPAGDPASLDVPSL